MSKIQLVLRQDAANTVTLFVMLEHGIQRVNSTNTEGMDISRNNLAVDMYLDKYPSTATVDDFIISHT